MPKAENFFTIGAVDYFRERSALCVTVDGFSDTNSSFVFNLLVSVPIHFHTSSFRLGSRRESDVNIDLTVSQSYNALINSSNDTLPLNAYGLVSD